MKKKLCFLVVVFIIANCLFSCAGKDKIASVEIDDAEYHTLYLYSFKDADVDREYSLFFDTDTIPTSTGYIYSTQKLSPGDTIRVWTDYVFHTDSSKHEYDSSSGGPGTDAIVEEIVDTFYVSIEEKSSTYKISYYQQRSSCVSSRQELSELTEHKIEVVKERVIIKYE